MSISQKIMRTLYLDKEGIKELPKGSTTPAQAKAVKLFDKFPPFHKMPLWMARPTLKIVERLFGTDNIDLDHVVNHQIILRDNHKITIREYRNSTPSSAKNKAPALMFFHGGGCVIGDIDSHDRYCSYIAKQSGLAVFSVDYRLGPEYKFPTAIHDAVDAWNWLSESAETLGIDLEKTGTGGDSAGGYLATLVAQLKRASNPLSPIPPMVMPAFQWLIYPMMDLRGESESYKKSTSDMMLTADIMNYFSKHYLNNSAEKNNPLASPLLCEHLDDLPPAYVLTVGHDPLMDCGIEYADKLKQANNDVVHEHFEHQMHNFIVVGGICPYALETMNQSIEQLKRLAS